MLYRIEYFRNDKQRWVGMFRGVDLTIKEDSQLHKSDIHKNFIEFLRVINPDRYCKKFSDRGKAHCYFTEIGYKAFYDDILYWIDILKLSHKIKISCVKYEDYEILYEDIHQVVIKDKE